MHNQYQSLWDIHVLPPGDVDEACQNLHADGCNEGNPGVVFAGMKKVNGGDVQTCSDLAEVWRELHADGLIYRTAMRQRPET